MRFPSNILWLVRSCIIEILELVTKVRDKVFFPALGVGLKGYVYGEVSQQAGVHKDWWWRTRMGGSEQLCLAGRLVADIHARDIVAHGYGG